MTERVLAIKPRRNTEQKSPDNSPNRPAPQISTATIIDGLERDFHPTPAIIQPQAARPGLIERLLHR